MLFALSMLGAFYLAYLLMDWPLLYRTFGFRHFPPYVGLFLVAILGQKAGFFLSPFYMALSRRFERQADRFAVKLLKSSSTMVTVLKRLAADNLSNLFPHPLYVRFHYSHPPLMERISRLEEGFRKRRKHFGKDSPIHTPHPGSYGLGRDATKIFEIGPEESI